jgi:hypothetical protein
MKRFLPSSKAHAWWINAHRGFSQFLINPNHKKFDLVLD